MSVSYTHLDVYKRQMQSIAFTYSLVPALKKLYPNKEDMIPVLQRHMELFNTKDVYKRQKIMS